MTFKTSSLKTVGSVLIVLILMAGLACPISAAPAGRDAFHVASGARPAVEVVFVLDTTGSMGGLIAAAKEKIWSIANTLATGAMAT